MKSFVLVAVLCFLRHNLRVVDGALVVEVNPPEIEVGLTPKLTVKCIMTHNFSANVASMILSKSDGSGGQGGTFTELVSITELRPDSVNILANTSAVASGHVDRRTNSTLALEWSEPSATEAGLYRCEVNEVDLAGHLVTFIQYASVTAVPLDLALVEELKNQLCQLNSLMATLEKDLNSAIPEPTDSFYPTEVYNGRQYLLSKHYWTNVDVAQSICEDNGGYLAEINDRDEFEFIVNFTSAFEGNTSRVLVGATDEGSEGSWRFRYSGDPITFTAWGVDQPAVAENDCVVMLVYFQGNMTDYPCYDFPYETLRNFLCEVPL